MADEPEPLAREPAGPPAPVVGATADGTYVEYRFPVHVEVLGGEAVDADAIADAALAKLANALRGA